MSDRGAHDRDPASSLVALPVSPDDPTLSVLVMGMHRSGTSAVAAVLNDAGISAGPSSELWPPMPDNPRFYGERPDIGGFNERLLAALGWTWDAPAPAPDPSPPRCDEQVAEGRRLLKGLLGGSLRLLKDPRISVLLPWWRRMTLDRFVAIVPVRRPDEVAWSLAVRDALPHDLAIALWLAYHRHMAAGLEGLPVIVVDYDALTTDPSQTVRLLLDGLATVGIGGTLDREAAAAAVVPALRRPTQPAPDGSSPLLAEAERILAEWRQGVVTVHERFARAVTTPTTLEIDLLDLQRRLRVAIASVESGQRERDRLELALLEARADVGALRTELAAAIGDRERLRADLERARTEVARKQAAVRHDVAEAVEASHEELDATRAELGAAIARAERLQGEVDAYKARLEGLLAEVRAEAEAIGSERARADAAHAQLDRALGGLAQRSSRGGRWRSRMRKVLTLRSPWPLLPNPLFDAAWYLRQQPDVAASGARPWWHYRRHGWREGRDPNAWFDVRWYLARNPDVAQQGIEPLDHYLEHGWREGRDPGPRFSTRAYIRENPDVAIAGMNPLLHFMRHGQAEGRQSRSVDGTRRTAAASESGTTQLLDAGGRSRPSRGPSRIGPRVQGPPRPVARPSDGDAITAATAVLPAAARVLVGASEDADWLGQVQEQGAGLIHPGAAHPSDPVGPGARFVVDLETRRQAGSDHLLLPASSAWWLERWPELRRYVAHFRARVLPGGVLGWDLRSAIRSADVEGVLATITGIEARPPAVLCWGVPEHDVDEVLQGARPFSAEGTVDSLPYLDASIDIVAIGEADDRRLDEAIRVASWAVVRVGGPRREAASVAWQAPLLSKVAAMSVAPLGGAIPAGDPLPARLLDALPPIASGSVVEASSLPGPAGGPGGGWVLVFDGTTWPVPGTVEAMVAHLARDPGAIAVSGSRSPEARTGSTGPSTLLPFALLDRDRLGALGEDVLGSTDRDGFAVPSALVRAVPSAVGIPPEEPPGA